jgi:hypothetical protein
LADQGSVALSLAVPALKSFFRSGKLIVKHCECDNILLIAINEVAILDRL